LSSQRSSESGDWGKVIVNAGNWLCGGGGTPTTTPTATAGSDSNGYSNSNACGDAYKDFKIYSNTQAASDSTPAPEFVSSVITGG
jgi:hypothetical protein